MITAAARALAMGDPLGALNRVALRDDPPALALRGIAIARLGDFDRAKSLLRSAIRAFGPKEATARARCVVAEAEIALASRDLGWPAQALDKARTTLEQHGDWLNAAYARSLEARWNLLTGKLDQAEDLLTQLDPDRLPPALRATNALVAAGIAMRRLQTKPARSALSQAEHAAAEVGEAALSAEVENASQQLDAPIARLIMRDEERLIILAEIESLLQSDRLIVDALRHTVCLSGTVIALARRPVLFALARALGEAFPGDVARGRLIALAFRGKYDDESHRARLRVEIARLRTTLRPIADIRATQRGFVLSPGNGCEVAVLARLADEAHTNVLACLADGESWSSSALALALGTSQRSIQRALDALAATGKVQTFGRGRARRWMSPPVAGFATPLLLPALVPGA